MKLFNTLAQQKEEFSPIDGNKVGFYACGPTVYDVAHIGNFRTYLFEDILKRALIANHYEVKHVMNVTDVDDKTILKGERKSDKFKEVVKKYEELFFADLKKLNISKPDVVTKPTEYVEKMVLFIEDLMERGFAYEAKDNSIYFSIDKFKDYGKLSRLDKSGIKIGARVEKDEYNKENPADFALWKAWDEDDGEIFWETSLGKGRPGWHIECSTMANDVLGETIDIHAGAVDLIFPHHENEIAQSEAKNGKPFVKYWIHGEHLLVDGKKMSKSLGNLYSLGDLEKKGFSPMDLRYLVFGTQYRSKLNFTWEGLTSAKNARERLSRFILENKSNEGQILDKYLDAFMSKVNDDLDTSAALAVLWEMIRDENAKAGDKSKTFFEMNKIIGLVFQETKSAPKEVAILAEERKKAREDKDFQKSDEIRNQIEDLGWVIEDLPENRYELKEY